MKHIYGVDSIFGNGQTFYDESGNYVGSSIPGVGGGEDFYFVNGETGFTVPGIGGGADYYGSDGKTAYTVNSLLGGKDIYGDVNGFSVDSPFGGSEIILNEGDL